MSIDLKEGTGWEALFYPSAIAVAGASPDLKKPGGIVLANLRSGGFAGAVYPVNPGHRKLGGWPCYPEIGAVPGPVDLAIISLKTPLVLPVLEECGAKGVKAAIVFSSGFGEVDEAGITLQQKLSATAARHSIRLCGPNTMGIINYLHRMQANFTFGFQSPSWAGAVDAGIALVSQSGGVGCSILTACAQHGLGVATYVCNGNEAVTDFADYLTYFVQRPEVKIIAGYMEGVRDGTKLGRAADLAGETGKPVVILKTGTHEASARAARSHTGSLAGSAAVYRAFFQQKGIIEVQSINEMMAVLSLLAAGRLPGGRRVVILASSGGHAVVAADKCPEAGLTVAQLSDETRRRLAACLPSYAGTANPVDFTGIDIVQPGLFRQCAAITAEDPGVDVLLLSHWLNEEVDSLGQLKTLAAETAKPLALAGTVPGRVPGEVMPDLIRSGVAYIGEVEVGARALAGVARYRERCGGTAGPPLSCGDPPAITGQFRSLKPGTVLGEREVKNLLGAYGIPVVPELAAVTADEAAEAAGKLGYPVAVKVDSPDIVHKTEAGGVWLNLTSPEEVRRAYAAVTGEAARRFPAAAVRGVLVQKMVRDGLEILVGLNRDPVFGMTMTFGLGGIWVEVLRDVSLRLLPVTEADIREMIREIKAYPLLAGARGRAPADLAALVKVLQGVARLGAQWPELTELDLNPLCVLPEGQGVYAVDAVAVI